MVSIPPRNEFKSGLEQELAELHLSKPRPNAHIITKSKLDMQK